MAAKKKKTGEKPRSGTTAKRGAAKTSQAPRSVRPAETRPRTDREVLDADVTLLVDTPEDGGRDDEWTDATGRVREPHDVALAGGDVDADVTGTGSGEEAVSGSASTPDQNDVDDIGRALGVSYQPDEPLHTTEKIARRDDERWELNPASSEDFAERQNPPREPQPRARPSDVGRNGERPRSASKKR